MSKRFLPYEIAKEKVQELGLCNVKEWNEYASSDRRPINIPYNPHETYKNDGWVNWYEWIGKIKKSVNHNYFKKWSHNMSYVLGLWWADGCICQDTFSIKLHKNDERLLKEVADEMSSTYPIYFNKNCRFISFVSKEMVADIKCRGGSERKSLICSFPTIPSQYLPDFIRGYFDGDGCVYKIKNKKSFSYRSTFVSGSSKFIYSLHSILKNEIDKFKGSIFCQKIAKGSKLPEGNFLKKQSIVYSLHIGINDTKRFRDYIYGDNSFLKMHRKHDKLQCSGDINIASYNKVFVDLHEFRSFLKDANIIKYTEWLNFCRSGMRPQNIPFDPIKHYKEWHGWKHWKKENII